MAVRAIIGLRVEGAKAGGEASERLRGLEGVSVLGAVASRKEGVAAVVVLVENLSSLRGAVEEVRKVEGVRDVVVLMGGGDLWAELAKMEGKGYSRGGSGQS